MNWLNGFKYRRIACVLSSSTKPLTDYPVRVEVRYGSGSMIDNCVYLEGKCQPDFSDVIIVDSDGVILAPKKDNCWIEEKVNGSHMIVWFKVPYIPKKPKKTVIYVYFGNDS